MAWLKATRVRSRVAGERPLGPGSLPHGWAGEECRGLRDPTTWQASSFTLVQPLPIPTRATSPTLAPGLVPRSAEPWKCRSGWL